MGCLATQMVAQASKEEGLAPQVPAAAPVQADQSSTPAAKSENPLDAFTEFSAIMVGTSVPIGDNSAEAYIYRSGSMMRMEGPEGHGYFVTDLSTRETYGVTPGPCMYDKTRPFVRTSPFITGKPGPKKVQRVAAGKETLDGHSCQIEDVTITQDSGDAPFKMRLWEADDLKGFPIRIDVTRGKTIATIRYKNVVLGPQDPTLFIHPKSCQSADVEHAVTHSPKLNAAPKKPATTPPPQ
jgi:hypothetical protein